MNFKKTVGMMTFALLLATSSAWAACTQDAECADSDPKTEDVCINAYCRHHAILDPTPTEPVPYEGPEDPSDGCMEPPPQCFEDPSQVDGPSLRRTCTAAIEINDSNASVTPKEAFCCLANESNENYTEEVWEKMKQDCGKIVKLKPHEPVKASCKGWPEEYRSCCEDSANDIDGDGQVSGWAEVKKAIDACTVDQSECSNVVGAMGDVNNSGQIQQCCIVIGAGASVGAIENACGNVIAGGSDGAATSETDDTTSSNASEAAPLAEKEIAPVSDFQHAEGAGCSLIR